MSITIHIFYTGSNGSAKQFAQEMVESGIVDAIRKEDGNQGYQYYFPMDDPETVLLIDHWRDQKALDTHHALPLMQQIIDLREKYQLHMKVERLIEDESTQNDDKFIRK